MKIKILYDNEAREGFKSGWGFSCLIEHGDKNILFDTGWDVNVLEFNMQKMGVAKEEIGIIALSHNHWDHIGGLASVLHLKAEVYVPNSFSKSLKKEISQRAMLHEIRNPEEIVKGVYTVGELGDDVKEQALALETKEGIVVVTGCAHPGLDVILDIAGKYGEVVGAIGGFHGFDKLDHLECLSLIVPCHCTTRKQDIEERFSERTMPCGAGQTIHLG